MEAKAKKRKQSDNEKFVEAVRSGDLTEGIPPEIEVTYLRLQSGETYYFEPKEEITVTGIRSFT